MGMNTLCKYAIYLFILLVTSIWRCFSLFLFPAVVTSLLLHHSCITTTRDRMFWEWRQRTVDVLGAL